MATCSALDNFIMMDKTRVKVIIPNSKESVRLPNKNRMLRHYTLRWLDAELQMLSSDYEVEVIELRNSKVAVDTSEDAKYSYQITPIYCPDEVSHEMRDLLAWDALHGSEVQIKILLQLTQPRRARGLLERVIKATEANPDRLTATYTKQPLDLWRVITPKGDNWQEHLRGDASLNYLPLYDGAVYGYTNTSLLWQHDKPKTMIENYKGMLIDIDTLDDYKRFMITETDNYQATLTEYKGEVENKEKEYNETITYTDEQRDYRTESRG